MPKKLISVLLAVFLLLSISAVAAVTAGAEDTAAITFEGKTYDIPVGDTFTVETKLTMPGCAGAGGRVILRFDTSVIQAVGNDHGDICETDLGEVTSVCGYTADGTGCSFAFASTAYSNAAVLEGDKNTLSRFFFRVKSAGSTEIVFDSAKFEYTVYTDPNANPTAVVSAGKEVGSANGYTFIGNVLTVGEFNYQEQTDPPSNESNGDQPDKSSDTQSDGNDKSDSDLGSDANDGNDSEVYIPADVTDIPDYSVGYKLEDGEYVKIDGFTIYGHKGSAAEEYANANGFTFIDADETPFPEADSDDGVEDTTTSGGSSSGAVGAIIAVIAVIVVAAGVVIAVVIKKKKD